MSKVKAYIVKLFNHLIRYPVEGLLYFLTTQRSSKLILILIFIQNLFLQLRTSHPIEYAVLNFLALLVLITELLNSSVEAAVDLVTEEWHEKAKAAKDTAAAAEFVAVLTWLGLFYLIIFGDVTFSELK